MFINLIRMPIFLRFFFHPIPTARRYIFGWKHCSIKFCVCLKYTKFKYQHNARRSYVFRLHSVYGQVNIIESMVLQQKKNALFFAAKTVFINQITFSKKNQTESRVVLCRVSRWFNPVPRKV